MAEGSRTTYSRPACRNQQQSLAGAPIAAGGLDIPHRPGHVGVVVVEEQDVVDLTLLLASCPPSDDVAR